MAPETATLLLALLAGSAELQAQPDPTRESARRHYARGSELVSQGQYHGALSEFLAAYQAQPHPATLYNIGQAYIELGQPMEAIDALERYLKESGDAAPPERVQRVREQLTQQRARTAELTITLPTVGASIWVDGKLTGTGPSVGPLRLMPGVHDVALTPPDVAGMHQTIVLSPAQAFRFAWPVVAPVPAAPVPAPSLPSPSDVDSRSDRATTTLSYWLGGAGLALGAVAFGHYLWNRERYDRWRTEQTQLASGDATGPDYLERQRDNNQLAASIEGASNWTVALVVAGGTLFASGATLLVVTSAGGDAGDEHSATWVTLQGVW